MREPRLLEDLEDCGSCGARGSVERDLCQVCLEVFTPSAWPSPAP